MTTRPQELEREGAHMPELALLPVEAASLAIARRSLRELMDDPKLPALVDSALKFARGARWKGLHDGNEDQGNSSR